MEDSDRLEIAGSPIGQHQARREARRRELAHRRRTLAGLSLLLVAAAVAAVVLLTGGEGSTSSSHGVAGSHSSARQPSSAGATTRRPGTERVPILMYHVINPPPAGAPFPGLYVPASEFAAQMQALAKAGYHAITMDQMWAYWKHGTMALPAGKKPIVVSFDNGYQSQYTNALPVLRRLGWVGEENLQLTGLPPSQGGLSEAQVKGLVAAGWELDTQGFSHADLIAIDATQLAYQVATARSVIRRRYGVPANWFCYPSGHYDATVVAASNPRATPARPRSSPAGPRRPTTPTDSRACASSAAPVPRPCSARSPRSATTRRHRLPTQGEVFAGKIDTLLSHERQAVQGRRERGVLRTRAGRSEIRDLRSVRTPKCAASRGSAAAGVVAAR